MRALAFDFETGLIEPEIPFPKPVCMSSVTFDTHDASARQPAILETADDGVARLQDELERGTLFCNAFIGFDVLVAWRWYPETRAQWAHAMQEERLTDIFRRQFLIDVANDVFRRRYALDNVAEALDVAIPNKKNPWRLRYAELHGVPISEYPEEASAYALEDAECAAEIYRRQELLRAAPIFDGADCLAPEFFNTNKTIACADMSGCGMHANPEYVEIFREVLETEAAELRETLFAHDLIVRKVMRNQSAITQRVFGWNPLIPKMKGGKPSLASKHYPDDAPLDVQCVAAKGDDRAAADNHLVQAGLADVVYSRSDKNARALMADALLWERAPDDKINPWRDEHGAPQSKPPLDADACRQTAKQLREADPGDSRAAALLAYSRYQSVKKTLTTDIKLAASAAFQPFCARYSPAKSGREVTSEVGNLQNMPRQPGVRELWVAPDGEVFISADYPALQLRTFAQICYSLFGFSSLREDLNDPNKDPHSQVVADLLHVTLEEILRRKKEGEPFISEARTMGKGLNFGAKGGMGAERFVGYVWNNYGVDLNEYIHLVDGATEAIDVARYLLDIHEARTPEFRPYKRKYVASFERPGCNVFDSVMPYSGMLCAGLRYSDACNFPFAHLETVVTGIALINAFLARHGFSDMGEADPLYGAQARVCIHDEIVYSTAESVAAPAAQRLADIMADAAKVVMPDVNTPVEPCIHRQLSKLAEPTFNAAGELVPWDVWKAAHAVRHNPKKLARFPSWVALQFKGKAA